LSSTKGFFFYKATVSHSRLIFIALFILKDLLPLGNEYFDNAAEGQNKGSDIKANFINNNSIFLRLLEIVYKLVGI